MEESVKKLCTILEKVKSTMLTNVLMDKYDKGENLKNCNVIVNPKTGFRTFLVNGKMDVENKNLKIMDTIIQFLTLPLEELKKKPNVFTYYDAISLCLTKDLFSNQEIVSIFKYMAYRSKIQGISSVQAICLDMQKIENYSFQTISRKQKREYLQTDYFSKLLREQELLTEEEKKQRKEILSLSDILCVDGRKNDEVVYVNKVNHILNEHWQDYSLEDIDTVLENLGKLHVREFCLSAISKEMKNEYFKRNKMEEKNTKKVSFENKKVEKKESPEKKNTQVENSTYLTNKEYKKLLGKVRQFYSIEKDELKCEIMYQDILEVVSSLFQLEYEKESRSFLKKSYSVGNVSLQVFAREYPKYVECLGEAEVRELEEYLLEMMLGEVEDFPIWEKAFLEEMKVIQKKAYQKTYTSAKKRVENT